MWYVANSNEMQGLCKQFQWQRQWTIHMEIKMKWWWWNIAKWNKKQKTTLQHKHNQAWLTTK
jgi:hypothetical protein